MLVVNIQNLENGILLRCTGRIVAGEEVGILRTAALAHADAREMILDLSCVTAIDGGGIGLLAFLQGRARASGCRLRIQNPSHHVRQLLELTNMDSVVEICPSREFAEICDVLGSHQPEVLAQSGSSR
jgi:anti-anti-sigma factor